VAWWVARQERLRRRRPRAAGLTIERILLEALALVDGEGLEALTVRRLAERLGTGSATLYRHVASRDELLVLLVDHVLGEVQLPDPDPEADARAKVEQLARDLRHVLLQHPNVVPALRAAPLLGPNALRAADSGLAVLLEAGHPPDTAVPAYLAVIDYVLGSVFFDTARTRETPPEPAPTEHEADEAAHAIPALWAHHRRIADARSDDVFAFAIRTFLDGLEGATAAASHASVDR
jgi:AcrR family transcriptional regulator